MFQPFLKSGDWQKDLPSLLLALDAFRDSDSIALLSNACALLHWSLDDVNWTGFYLWNSSDEELVVGPFQGLPACIRIPPSRGVCGKAVSSREVQRIDDVLAFPGHIACDAASRSELVIPILVRGEVYGVLDIDSPTPGRFSQADQEALQHFAQKLSQLLQDTH
ncbi:MAG: GAF domain-containing protein [Spirochaetales bacterium]|nr:GAF domain-containing protein [Spirochaetales bacterium]